MNNCDKGYRSEGEHVGAPRDRLLGTAEDAKGKDVGREMIEINDEPEEAEPLTIAPSPTLLSPAAVEEHRLSHIPFRRWCRWCIMGRGLGEQRGRHQGRGHTIALIGVDYFYITVNGIEKRTDLEFAQDDEGERLDRRSHLVDGPRQSHLEE